jgi:hypothetical protein
MEIKKAVIPSSLSSSGPLLRPSSLQNQIGHSEQLRRSNTVDTQTQVYLQQCCPTFLCTRAQFTDAYGGAGATTLLLLLKIGIHF